MRHRARPYLDSVNVPAETRSASGTALKRPRRSPPRHVGFDVSQTQKMVPAIPKRRIRFTHDTKELTSFASINQRVLASSERSHTGLVLIASIDHRRIKSGCGFRERVLPPCRGGLAPPRADSCDETLASFLPNECGASFAGQRGAGITAWTRSVFRCPVRRQIS